MVKTKKTEELEEGYKLSPTGEIVPDYDTNIKCFDEGDVLEGSVVHIERAEVLVDVGYKSEGVIPVKELTVRGNARPKDIVEIGQDIKTVVLQKEDNDGRLILSKKRADFEKCWDDIDEANKAGKTIKGQVIQVVKGGLILDVGVRGFLPASLIELNRVKDLDQYRNQELECKIIELNRVRNNVVLSRKAALSNDNRSDKQKMLEKLEIGQKVKGVVSSIVDFGAFVDLGGIDGLIHISEISWEHVNHPSEVVSIDEELEVHVLDIDLKKARVSLGLKQSQEDPWKEKLKGFEEGKIVKGKVSRILPFGVFIEFGDNLEGLIHITELAHGRVSNSKDVVDEGQEVEAKLIGIDLSRRRISLSIKQLTEKKPEEDSEGEEKKEETKKKTKTKKEEEKPKVETKEEDEEKKEVAKTKKKTDKKEKKTKPKSEDKKAKTTSKKEDKKSISKEDEALLEKLAQGPTKVEDEAVNEVPDPNSLEDVLDQMKKSHGAKK